MSGGQDVQAYLQDVDFHLEMRPSVTDKERLYQALSQVMALEDAQHHESATLPPNEWRSTSANRERDSYGSTQPHCTSQRNLKNPHKPQIPRQCLPDVHTWNIAMQKGDM
ncbi:hypothetical protein QQF64_001179 [Cirrhinus molitorella]|uniref:Uncharacterized protein n=1 Tax=Cirrhinus molitorella TaxID=172907 RepID=A0ABR3NZY0_9TELE